MSAPRFFVELDLAGAAEGDSIELPDAVAHHAIRVARLAVGNALTLFNGAGGECAATVERIDKRGARVRLERFDAVERESPLAVTLAQAVAANDAMDYAIRKATELGAAAIAPLVTTRSAPLPHGPRADKRHAHWRQVAIAACEQCGRNRVPGIDVAQPLAAWLDGWNGSGIVLDPAGDVTLAALPTPRSPLAVLVGPEGGLAAHEIAHAKRCGLVAVRTGPRVLRTETAGVTVLAALQTLWGDWR